MRGFLEMRYKVVLAVILAVAVAQGVVMAAGGPVMFGVLVAGLIR